MFQLECVKDNIALHSHEDPSIAALGATWAMLDTSRLLQSLINLLTNAIKFTHDRRRRNVTVTTGATLDRLPEV